MTSSKNLFAWKISRLIASAGSLALSILPCSIGSRGARLNGFQFSCAQAGQARTEPSKPAHSQRAGERTGRAARRDNDGRARRVGRNILSAGASREQMTREHICVVIMFARIHLRRTTASNRLSYPLNAPSQGSLRTLSAACRIPTYDLAIQSDEKMTGYFRTFLIVASRVLPDLGRRIRRLARAQAA